MSALLASLVVGPVEFDRPWWLVAVPVLGLATWWLSRKSLSGLGGATKWTALVFRLLVIAALAGALAEPHRRRVSERVAVTVVLDSSRSIPASSLAEAAAYIERERAEASGREFELGVVTVARDAFVQSLPGPRVLGIDRQYVGRTDATDLSEGVALALAVAPRDAANRLLLLSDGNETSGSLLSAAQAAEAAGVPVDVLPVRYENASEVIVENLIAPANARAGETVSVSVLIEATRPVTGRLTITANGEPVDLDASTPGNATVVRLDAGKNRLGVSLRPPRPGPQLYEASFEPLAAVAEDGTPVAGGGVGDSILENNRASAVTFVAGEGRALVVGDARQSEFLISALERSGVAVERRGPDGLPAGLTGLNEFEAVFLVNQPAEAFSTAQQEDLRRYVHDSGGGLVMTGGPDSFGAGGWIGSPLEDALPVRLDPPQKRRMPRGALALVVHSVEIPRGVFWGKEVSRAAVEALSSRDLVGIVEFRGFDSGTDWVLPMSAVGDRSAARRAINGLQFGDMPDFDPSLRLALQGLTSVEAGQRHCIVISDGDPTLSPSLLQRYRDAGVSISAVGVFPHSPGDTSTLQRMAEVTNGRYYGVNTRAGLATLPQIFIKEARTVRRALIWEGDPFSPDVTGAPVESMRGIASVPPVTGYVVADEREGLAVTTLRATRRETIDPASGRAETVEDPIAAQWQYGLGRAAVFTSDVTARWGRAWVEWGGFEQFWAQHARWVMRPAGSGNVRIATEQRGEQTVLLIDALDDSGERLNFARFRARVAAPGGEGRDVAVRQVGPGRYEGVIDSAESGTYVVSMRYAASRPGAGGEPRRVEGSVQAAVTRPFADEFRSLETNLPLLNQVAGLTGGEVLTGDTAVDEPWRREGLEKPVDLTAFWLTLALTGVGLFVADVGVRRVRLDPRAAAAGAARLFARAGARKAAGAEQLGSLRDAREQARRRMSGSEPGAAGGDREAEAKKVAQRKFEADPERAASGQVALAGEQERGASAELRKPPPASAKKDAAEEEGGMSRLMRAKREAKEKFERGEDEG